MFLGLAYRDSVVLCFPRMRGDVPLLRRVVSDGEGFSPHARGCSSIIGTTPTVGVVFPACAGMFLGGKWCMTT